MTCELLNRALGINVTLVPYRNQGQLNQDMMAGRVDYQCALTASLVPLIQAGRLKGIATLGKERNSNLPNLPSAHEQGLTGFGFFMPKGAPERIVRHLSEATNGAMNTSSVQEKVQALAATLDEQRIDNCNPIDKRGSSREVRARQKIAWPRCRNVMGQTGRMGAWTDEQERFSNQATALF